jgi:hypothetical protein
MPVEAALQRSEALAEGSTQLRQNEQVARLEEAGGHG